MKRSIARRLLLGFILVSLVPLTLLALLYLRESETSLRQQALMEMSRLADKKADQIDAYINERLADARVMAHSEPLSAALHLMHKAMARDGVAGAEHRRLSAHYDPGFRDFLEASGYYDLLLIDAAGNVVYTVAKEADLGGNLLSGPLRNTELAQGFRQAMATLSLELTPFRPYAPSANRVSAFIVKPLMDAGRPVGALALQLNLERLREVVTDRTGLGRSGETVLAQRNGDQVLYTAPLARVDDAAYKHRVPFAQVAPPMRQALSGGRGMGVVPDYARIEVAAAWRYLPSLGWGMVVKKDMTEVLEPINQLRRASLAALGVVALLAAVAALFLGRTLTRPIANLGRAASAIATGDLVQRVESDRQDELGQLADAFNRMVDRLQEARDRLEARVEARTAELLRDQEQQRTLREMLEDVVREGSMQDILGRCLDRLLAVSWLSLLPRGGIFLMQKDGQTLRLTASHNLSSEILSLCDRVALGCCHCGQAAASRQMQFSDCLDHRHEISYPGMAEHGHYNLPLLSEDEVVGVLVLYLPPGFERDPDKEQFLTTVADVLAGFIRRKHAEETLRQLNEALEDRVVERTLALVAARDEAERASRAKSEFLSRMSHELRTPLNAILGFGQLLELHLREAEQVDNVREILHAGRHLLELINEVLDLARIEAGRFNINPEPIALRALIVDCLALIRPQAEARGIRISIHSSAAEQDCDAQVLADGTRLKQVLINLLSNAVKYNRDQGELSVVCVNLGGSVQIRISDTGAGLSPEQQTRLFVAFERLDADRSATEGTGIGLALSKRLVELMRGEIGVESSPGSGSTFWFTLPAATPVDENPVLQGSDEHRFNPLC